VQSACECEGISTKSFFEWLRRGETGEAPFSKFSYAVTRARGRFKARVCKSIIEDRDWRARLELIARIYPQEFARTEPRIIMVPAEAAAANPTTVIVNVERSAESDAQVELFGERPKPRKTVGP
jgi:hypothetical protein